LYGHVLDFLERWLRLGLPHPIPQ
jgi:hypothetical protein